MAAAIAIPGPCALWRAGFQQDGDEDGVVLREEEIDSRKTSIEPAASGQQQIP